MSNLKASQNTGQQAQSLDTNIHHYSKVSIQTAYENMSIVSHKPLLISNDWMKILLHVYMLLKISYLGMFSMEMCISVNSFYLSQMTNQIIGIKSVFQESYFEPLDSHNLWMGVLMLWKSTRSFKKHVRFHFITMGVPADCLQIYQRLRNLSLCKPSFYHGCTF